MFGRYAGIMPLLVNDDIVINDGEGSHVQEAIPLLSNSLRHRRYTRRIQAPAHEHRDAIGSSAVGHGSFQQIQEVIEILLRAAVAYCAAFWEFPVAGNLDSAISKHERVCGGQPSDVAEGSGVRVAVVPEQQEIRYRELIQPVGNSGIAANTLQRI